MENFNDGDYDGWQPVGRVQDCWKVVDGELCGDTDNPWGGELILNMGGWNQWDYNVASDVKFIEFYNTEIFDPYVAIGIRPEVKDNVEEAAALDGVTLKFGFKGTSITSRLRNKQTSKGKWFKEVFIAQMNHWYHLRLFIQHDTVKGYVGNQLTCELRVNTPPYVSPSVSFANAHVHFDNVILYGEAVFSKHARTTTTWADIKGAD